MLKPSVNDPQGLAVLQGLHALGFGGVEQVRVGKHIDVRLRAEDERDAADQLRAMCERLLANTLIERYDVAVSPALREAHA